MLALFTVLALIMFRMITRLEDHFMQITVAGISAWLLGQAVVNMMVVTGLLPVIGVPLPFISSGGSALLASMTALGLLLSFARREPGAQEAISARFGSVRRSVSVQPAPRDSAPPAARPAKAGRRGKAGRAAKAGRSSRSGRSASRRRRGASSPSRRTR